MSQIFACPNMSFHKTWHTQSLEKTTVDLVCWCRSAI